MQPSNLSKEFEECQRCICVALAGHVSHVTTKVVFSMSVATVLQVELACKRADLSLLVQLRSLPLDLLLVIAIQALDVVDCGLQVLHG